MRFGITTFFVITASVGLIIHVIQFKLTEQPTVNLLAALFVFCCGVLVTMMMSSLGYATGGRWGAIVSTFSAALVWLIGLLILDVVEYRSIAPMFAFHLTLIFVVACTTLWFVLRDPPSSDSRHPIDEELFSNLKDTKKRVTGERNF